ncbi:MAG: endo,3(4)-beta-glucanase [Firmicutes bacterium]|nr:endo,3(4)-beta-glucanase [Bacillota bacterium]
MKKLIVAALAATITVGNVMPAYATLVNSGANLKYQNTDGSWQLNSWLQEDGKWYHFDSNGNAQTGWFKDTDEKWYFFSYTGIMQTGLIKVDDNVYYMNDDGSLFVGSKSIDNTDYNFSEYGTTNGKPNTTSSQNWTGNGNQASVNSSTSSSTSSETSITKAKAISMVKSVITDANSGSQCINASISGSTITIKNKTEETASVDWNSKTFSSSQDLVNTIIEQGYSDSTNLSEVEETIYTITVNLNNGETMVYNVTLK